MGLLAFLFSIAVLVENAIASEPTCAGLCCGNTISLSCPLCATSPSTPFSTQPHPPLDVSHPAVQLYFYNESSYFASLSSLRQTLISYRQQIHWVSVLKVGTSRRELHTNREQTPLLRQ
jgi:hypothetical protein